MSSNRRQIATAAGIVGFASLIVYATSFLREVIVSMKFGTSEAMDALLVAYSIPLFVGLTASSVVHCIFVPFYAGVRERDPEGLERLTNRILTAFVILLLFITALLLLSAPVLVRWIGHGFGRSQSELCLRLMWILLPAIPFVGFTGLLTAIMNAEKIFWLPAVLPATAIIVTAGVVLLASGSLNIYSLAIGFTSGFAIQTILTVALLRRRGFRLGFGLAGGWSKARSVARAAWPLVLGSAATGTIVIIDRAMAAALPTGSVAALGYAEKLNSLALVVVGSLQAAVFPYFAEQASKGDRTALAADFKHTVQLIVFILAPVSLMIILWNRELVGLALQRGAFDVSATAATGDALIGYAIGLVPVAVGLTCARLAQSVQNYRLVGFQGAANPALKVCLNLLLIPLLRHAGIAYATSLMYTIGFAILLFGLPRDVGLASIGRASPSLVRMAVALLGLGVVVGFFRRSFEQGEVATPAAALVLIGGSLLGTLAYWLICYALRVEEARMVPALFRKVWMTRFGRGSGSR